MKASTALLCACLGWVASACGSDSGDAPFVRVVSLAPSLTELVFVLGFEDYLVGRTTACDYPEQAATIPVVGSFGRPTWEVLVRARPDVVLVTDLEKPGFLQQMRRRGMTPLVLPCESWDQLQDAARAIAVAVGRPQEGEQWAGDLQLQIEELRAAVDAFWAVRPQRPSLYAEIWGQPTMTVGRNTFLHAVMLLAGARPLSRHLRGDYISVSSEWLLQEDPDAILLAYMLPDLQAAQMIKDRPGWSRLSAVQQDHIITNIDPDWLLRPGPRLLLGARALAEELQTRFADP